MAIALANGNGNGNVVVDVGAHTVRCLITANTINNGKGNVNVNQLHTCRGMAHYSELQWERYC